MAKYVIKNNLPKKIITETGDMNKREAAHFFLGLVNHLNTNDYKISVMFRNEKGKDLRGTISVEIDGFFYYVELYKV